MPKAQQGLVPILLLYIATIGIVFYILIASILPLANKRLIIFHPKPVSQAATSTDTSYDMGVLVIKYFPLTVDNQKIDIVVTGDVGEPLGVIKQRTLDVTNNLKTALEKSTKYLGYKESAAQSALTYQIIDTKEFELAIPMLNDGSRRPNYQKIMTDLNICDFVEKKGVSEVWLWAYQGPTYPNSAYPYLNISESKMSGPFGDISNSPRYNDMPLCEKTYRVYTFNYGRFTAEALESWGHQIEVEMDEIDKTFFRDKWQGPNYPQTLAVKGRCGSTHNPPNARFEYDRANSIAQKSDCLDWNSDSLGVLSDISCQNWGCSDSDPLTNNASLNYQIWNWQNLPGRGNTKIYQGKKLRNFWDIHGDFDRVMKEDKTIFLTVTESPSPSPVSSPTPSPSPTPTPTSSPTPSPTPRPTLTPTPRPSPTKTPSPSPTPRPTLTSRPSIRATLKPTPSPTPRPTLTPTPRPVNQIIISQTPPPISNINFREDKKEIKDCGVFCQLGGFITNLNKAIEKQMEQLLSRIGIIR